MDEKLIRSAMEEGITNTAPSVDKEFWKLAVELWKIEKKLQKCKDKLSEEDNKSFEFLFNRTNQIFWSNNVKVTDFSNQKWNEWMSLLDIVSVEEDEWLEFPVIGETITPLIEVNWNVVQRSKVIIYKPKEKEIVKSIYNKKILWLCLIFLLVIILLVMWISLLYHKNSNNEENINVEEQTNVEVVWTAEENEGLPTEEKLNKGNLNENIENDMEQTNEESNQEILENIESTDKNTANTEENIGGIENNQKTIE